MGWYVEEGILVGSAVGDEEGEVGLLLGWPLGQLEGWPLGKDDGWPDG